MAIEAVKKEQAELKGQFDQFGKRVDRMDAGFADLRRDLGNTQKWQLSFIIAAVIAICAVAGLILK